MIATSEDDLVCDFAETYGIYNIRSLPAGLAATLAVGLRGDSRIKTRMRSPEKEPDIEVNTLLLAKMADSLAWLVWSKTEDAQKNRNQPRSLVNILLRKEDDEDRETNVYASPEEFNRAWKQKGGGIIGN